MKRGPAWRYFPETAKSLFIAGTPGQEEADNREVLAAGLYLTFLECSWYLGAYLGPREELEA